LTNWVTVWAFPESEFDSETLLPQGLFLKLDQTGRDPSKWSEQGWLWNDIYYENSKVFRAAWADNKVSKLARNKEYDVDGVPWTGTDKPLDRDLPGDNAPPPVAIAPGGTRYSVDEENSFVTWQDWSLYWTFSRDTGMRYFDIRFRNTTIVYELGLEEALAHYAGQDPVQSGIGYIDSFYGTSSRLMSFPLGESSL
jgi:primary-amine oxidase